jgi:hypothetical protein
MRRSKGWMYERSFFLWGIISWHRLGVIRRWSAAHQEERRQLEWQCYTLLENCPIGICNLLVFLCQLNFVQCDFSI